MSAPEVVPSGFFVARTPLLPFDVLERWADGLEARGRYATEALGDALAADVAALDGRLRALVRDPVVREALFCASPSVDEAVEAWLADPESPRARGLTPILVRYLVRMASRPTPFGLFAGNSLGDVDDRAAGSRLVLAPRRAYERRSRLDMSYVCLLVDRLERDPALRLGLRLSPSTGLYASGEQLRYAEARVDPATRERSYHLVSVDRSEALTAALDAARDGARPAAIAAAVARAIPDVSVEEASTFVDELVDAQILASDLAPPLTGPDPLAAVVGALRAAEGGAPVSGVLAAARAELSALDEAGLGASPERYRAIAEGLGALPIEAQLARLFQVDLWKPAPEARLGGRVVAEIVRGIDVLRRVGRPADRGPLDAFIEAFERRYERREVPLCEALDEERGIGFGPRSADACPLLDGITFPLGGERPAPHPRDGWLANRCAELARAGAREWSLSDRDLADLTVDPSRALPDAFSVMVTLAAGSAEACDAGDFRLWLGIMGPSGATLFGRFCHGDPELRRRVDAHLRAEEALQPDAIFAEVVHLPEGRTGNVLCRPVLRAHEITYLGRSGASAEKQIRIDELTVSVRGRRVVLGCPRLGREIVPRLTSAHVGRHAPHVFYRFLCALVAQDKTSAFAWDWGAVDGAPFLPRVTCGRMVVARARWMLSPSRVKALTGATGAARFRAAQRIRDEIGLPRWITASEGDNILAVDLDNALGVEAWAGLLKGKGFAPVSELFPAPDELCLRGPEGRFVHQLVIPFVVTKPAHAAAPMPPAPRGGSAPRARRTFPPGSEWLFVKIYAGTATLDRLLTDIVGPLVDEALASGAADGWHFLRYGDPDWHLRLRLHGAPSLLLSRFLPALERALAPWLADTRVWRFTVDTYAREIERYGGDLGIELAEAIFDADSRAALAILGTASGDELTASRWRAAFVGMHALLCDLGLDDARRLEVVRGLRASFGREHKADVKLERDLGAKFRAERAGLEALLAPVPPHAHPLPDVRALLDQRSARLGPVTAELASRASRGELSVDLGELAAAFLHMHGNRLLADAARAQELVLYDWLARLYESQAARARAAARER